MDKKLNETLQNLRVHYRLSKLDIEDCDADPIEQFDKWLEHAIETHCEEPNAFVLSTIDGNRPRARVLLLKGIEDGKFIFYTNYQSAKGQELAGNPNASMTFLWLPLHRQVRIEGKIAKISADESDAYFHKRPRGSQLGAIASPQSKKVISRAELEKLFQNAAEKFESLELLPRPAHWGGYSLTPEYFEFWQGRDNRMHDRIGYSPQNNSWKKFRLAP